MRLGRELVRREGHAELVPGRAALVGEGPERVEVEVAADVLAPYVGADDFPPAFSIVVTLEVSHPSSGWSKRSAPLKTALMSVTLEVSHSLSGWSNRIAELNMD